MRGLHATGAADSFRDRLQAQTLLKLHQALIQRKYRRLFSATRPTKPGPKGPRPDVVAAIVEINNGIRAGDARIGSSGRERDDALVVSCHLAVGSPASVYEGITVSKGFVDYANPEDPDLTMNGTIFHVLHEDEN